MSNGHDDRYGNGSSGWRWTIGILLTIQMAILSWLVVRVDQLSQVVYAGDGKSTRAILDERTNTWVPIIVENRQDLNKLQREVYELKYDVERMKRNGG